MSQCGVNREAVDCFSLTSKQLFAWAVNISTGKTRYTAGHNPPREVRELGREEMPQNLEVRSDFGHFVPSTIDADDEKGKQEVSKEDENFSCRFKSGL